MHERSTARRTFVLITACLASLCCATFALADKIHLNDGRVLEGRVESEGDDYVYFLLQIGVIEKREIILREDIKEIVLEDHAPVAGIVDDADLDIHIPEGATKIAFITLGDPPLDMVGTYLNADALRRSKEILDDLPAEQKPDIVVLHINSGGGYTFETIDLSDAIHKELKEDYRVVGWIESAISAASFTIYNCEELYMMKQGHIGGTVQYISTSSGAKASEGEDLERVLDHGRSLSIIGRRNPYIMEAMQRFMTLSCDIDESGNVTWYNTDQGEHLVSPADRILTLNSVDAVKYRVCKAIADTKDELARAMGCTEWVEVGHKADEYQHEFRENVRVAEARAGELWSKINIAMNFSGGTRKNHNRQISTARRYLGELKALVRKAPSLEKYGAAGLPPLNDDWFRDIDKRLRDMAAPRG